MEINSRLNSDPYHNHVYTFTFNITYTYILYELINYKTAFS